MDDNNIILNVFGGEWYLFWILDVWIYGLTASVYKLTPTALNVQMGSFRKFFIESNDKTGRQVKSSMSEGSEAERLYYVLMRGHIEYHEPFQ